MAAFSASNTAPVKWAQRKDSIYLTISLSDVTDHKIDLKEKTLIFEGKSQGKDYSLSLEFVSYPVLIEIFALVFDLLLSKKANSFVYKKINVVFSSRRSQRRVRSGTSCLLPSR